MRKSRFSQTEVVMYQGRSLRDSNPEPKRGYGGQVLESAVKSRRCVVGESPIQGRISDPP